MVRDVKKLIHDCGGNIDGIWNILLTVPDSIYFPIMDRKKIDSHKDELTIPHASIVIALRDVWNDTCLYANGIDLLSDYFTKKNIPFRFRVCETPEKAEEEIRKKFARIIIIIGHGSYTELDFGKNGTLKYSKFQDLNPEDYKDLIGQFHCCTGHEGVSTLSDLILKPNGKKYVKKGFCCIHQNRAAIKRCIETDWNC